MTEIRIKPNGYFDFKVFLKKHDKLYEVKLTQKIENNQWIVKSLDFSIMPIQHASK